MSVAEHAFVWLVDSSVRAAVVLAIGGPAMRVSREPAVRQRIGEWTLSAALLLMVLMGIPGIRHYELGLLSFTSIEQPKDSNKGVDAQLRSRNGSIDTETRQREASTDAPAVSRDHDFGNARAKVPPGQPGHSAVMPAAPSAGGDDESATIRSSSTTGIWHAWIVGMYVCGVALFLVWLFVGSFGLIRLIRNSVPPTGDVQGKWKQLPWNCCSIGEVRGSTHPPTSACGISHS